MFRINIYLRIADFLKSIFFFYEKKIIEKKISKIILDQTNKKELLFASQCRIAFLYILKYFKYQNFKKNEIIFCSYNLADMVNIAQNLDYSIKFCDIDKKTNFIDLKKLRPLISNKTKAIVLTNMFNDFEQALKLKALTRKKNILLIEDNAIYFDNFKKKGNKKIYSGSIGDFSLYSFNIMKNISALYGGALATDDKKFCEYYRIENKKLSHFFLVKLTSQITIYLFLKIMTIKVLYKLLFFKVVRFSHQKNLLPLLKIFYPSLKFKKAMFPKYYFTKISYLSLKMIYLQLINTNQRNKNFLKRRYNNEYYYKALSKIKNKNFQCLKINDFNYQNFLDFPILVKNKKKFNIYLLNNGIETKYIHYKDCEKIFKPGKFKCINSKKFENELICLPNHNKVTKEYMDKIIKKIKIYLNEEKYQSD